MSGQASKAQEQNKRYTTLRLIGGVDCVTGVCQRYPDLDVNGGARIRKTLCVDGDARIRKTLCVDGDAKFGSDINIDGNLIVSGNFTFSSLIVDTLITDNIDANTGAIDILSSQTIESNVITAQTVTAEKFYGNLQGNICSDTTIQGDVVIEGNLQVTQIDGNLIVLGDLCVDGNIKNDQLLQLESRVTSLEGNVSVLCDRQIIYTTESNHALLWTTSLNILAKYDVVTTTFNIVGNMGQQMFDIAFSPSGILYGVDYSGVNLYTINTTTAATTLVGAILPLPPGTYINTLTFGSDGTLYAIQGTNLVTINPATAAVTVIGNTGFIGAGDLVFIDNRLYFTTITNQLLLINITNPPASVVIGPVPSTFGLATLFINDSCGGSYHMYGTSGNSLQIYEIDPATGATSNFVTLPSFGPGGGTSTQGATSLQFFCPALYETQIVHGNQNGAGVLILNIQVPTNASWGCATLELTGVDLYSPTSVYCRYGIFSVVNVFDVLTYTNQNTLVNTGNGTLSGTIVTVTTSGPLLRININVSTTHPNCWAATIKRTQIGRF